MSGVQLFQSNKKHFKTMLSVNKPAFSYSTCNGWEELFINGFCRYLFLQTFRKILMFCMISP